jgi:regulator of protease activity HflC (stomatin/prohibitin superfamily)
MQIVVPAVPGQEAITRDNLTLSVDAVVYCRVIDPLKAIINVHNHQFAVSQTSMRSVFGGSWAVLPASLSTRPSMGVAARPSLDAV